MVHGAAPGDHRAACRDHVFGAGCAYAYSASARGDFDVPPGGAVSLCAFGAALVARWRIRSPRVRRGLTRRVRGRSRITDRSGSAVRSPARTSLECSCRSLRRVHRLPIVPVLSVYSAARRSTRSRRDHPRVRRAPALLIASTDLSHYFDEDRATLDARGSSASTRSTRRAVGSVEQYPEHERGRYVACGGGAAVAV